MLLPLDGVLWRLGRLRGGWDVAAVGVLIPALGARAGDDTFFTPVVGVVVPTDVLVDRRVPVLDSRAILELPVPAAGAAGLVERDGLALTAGQGHVARNPPSTVAEVVGIRPGEGVPTVAAAAHGTDEGTEAGHHVRIVSVTHDRLAFSRGTAFRSGHRP